MARVSIKIPDKRKYYSVRTGSNLVKLRKWMKWAKKKYPGQKLILVNDFKRRLNDKKNREYWKIRYKMGLEERYTIYGSYK